MSSLGGTAPSERPERSRNAKAQARHRAKRKAYIDQLEQTVTKLQSQMGLSPDQISVLPPPMMKIRELEQENGRLLKENEELRRMLQEQAGGRPLDLSRRPLSNDTRNGERDYKRRKPDMDDHPYLSHASSMNDLRPPPPLTIPNGSSYGHVSSHNPTASGTALYGMNGGGGGGTHFQLPNTPSGSSSTSSPPFSASTIPSSSLHACPSGCARRIFDPSNVLFFFTRVARHAFRDAFAFEQPQRLPLLVGQGGRRLIYALPFKFILEHATAVQPLL